MNKLKQHKKIIKRGEKNIIRNKKSVTINLVYFTCGLFLLLLMPIIVKCIMRKNSKFIQYYH